jgi:hypothetical protein
MAKIESRFVGQLTRGQVMVLEVSRLQTCACVRACAREIRGSRGGVDRDSNLLGYYTVSTGKCFQTLQERLASVFIIRYSNPLLVLPHPEDEALRFSETSVTLYHSTWCSISEDLGPYTVRLMCLRVL